MAGFRDLFSSGATVIGRFEVCGVGIWMQAEPETQLPRKPFRATKVSGTFSACEIAVNPVQSLESFLCTGSRSQSLCKVELERPSRIEAHWVLVCAIR